MDHKIGFCTRFPTGVRFTWEQVSTRTKSRAQLVVGNINTYNFFQYVCTKPCARAKAGCTRELMGDRGEHQCRKKCNEKCDPCVVLVCMSLFNIHIYLHSSDSDSISK